MSKLKWKNPPRDPNPTSSGIGDIKSAPRPMRNGVPVYSLHEIMPFPKYKGKGKRISEVVKEDRGYINWLIREERIFIKGLYE